MIFSVGFSRLNPKPFNIFTCILQFLQPAGHRANPVQTSPCGPRYFTALSGFFFPSLGLKPKRADLRFELETARVLTL